MKIISTPPQRYRPRLDYEGDVGVSFDPRNGRISIRAIGEDRHWTIQLEEQDLSELMAMVQRRERMRG